MASMGEAELTVTVVRVDGGEFVAVECGRCAALIREDRKDKHASVCGRVGILEMDEVARAIRDTAKHSTVIHTRNVGL